MYMSIYIVVLHYGKLETTQKCVDSLAKHESEFEKIVLINNDEKIILSEKQFAVAHKKLHIINNKKNYGFAAGVNIGIRYSLDKKAEAIFLLNNDTIMGKDFLKKLANVLEKNKKIGIVGPAISFHKQGKTLYDLGGKVNLLIGRTQHSNVGVIPCNYPLQIVQYISGCCMLIARDVFEKIGFLDEAFFLYYEDVDFCLRAKQKGFDTALLPEVTIYHELSKAAGKVSAFSVYHQTKSGILFGRKYCKAWVLNVGFLFAQSCLFMVKSRAAGAGAFAGLRDGLQK